MTLYDYKTAEEAVADLGEERIQEILVSDDEYYTGLGTLFLSNSNVGTITKNPEKFGKPTPKTIPMIIGGYFHQRVLEPEKAKEHPYVDAPNRYSHAYKQYGKPMLLKKDIEKCNALAERLEANDFARGLIRGEQVQVEVPRIKIIEGKWWKGKADVVNNEHRLLVDLKTTSDVYNFRRSASRYNYDSQAFIYQELFGYEMMFIAIDKEAEVIGAFDCSTEFIQRGKEKVMEAVNAHNLFLNPENKYDFAQFLHHETLM